MNIKQLESVLEISRCGSMRQAAQNLYVTQPALSAAVKQLEQELDYAIFLRKPSGMTLTPEGRLLLQSAQRMVEEAQRIRHIPRLLQEESSLSISCTWSALLMDCFIQFRGQFPQEQALDDLRETGFGQCVRDVMDRTRRMSLIFCSQGARQGELQKLQTYHLAMEPLLEDVPAVCLLSKFHPLSRFPQVNGTQLAQCALVAYAPADRVESLEHSRENHGADRLSVFDRGGLMDAVDHGYVAVIPRDPVLEAAHPNLVARPLQEGTCFSLCLLRQTAQHFNPREEQFLSWLRPRLQEAYRAS